MGRDRDRPLGDSYYQAKHDQGKRKPLEELIGFLEPKGPERRVLLSTELALAYSGDGDAAVEQWLAVLAGRILVTDLTLGVGEVMHFGAQKYKWGSWRYVPNAIERYLNAGLRHYLPEEYYPESPVLDPESGLRHEAHAACNFGFVLQLIEEKEEKESNETS